MICLSLIINTHLNIYFNFLKIKKRSDEREQPRGKNTIIHKKLNERNITSLNKLI